MQGVSETGMDEAHCESHPHCWNGTELQHLATFLLWKTSEKIKPHGHCLPPPACISFICTSVNMLRRTVSNKVRYSFRLREFDSGHACYCSVQNHLSCSSLSKNTKIKTYSTIILCVLSYGCKTWTLTLREEHRLRVFMNRY
jgi:hypothetical protein